MIHELPKISEAFKPVPISEVRKIWPLLRGRLDELSQRNNWTTEDVFVEVIQDRAAIWITPGAKCFVICNVLVTAYSREFHCWIGCNDTMATPADYLPQVLAMGRERGCKTFTFESDRRGFASMPDAQMRYSYSIPIGDK